MIDTQSSTTSRGSAVVLWLVVVVLVLGPTTATSSSISPTLQHRLPPLSLEPGSSGLSEMKVNIFTR